MVTDIKILYVSWHEILEYDELKLFGELGYRYLSLGAYYNPYNDSLVGNRRPTLPKEPNLYDEAKGDYENRERLRRDQIEPFDVVIFMHQPTSTQPQITENWENLKGKKVIYRSIGQSIRVTEEALAPYKKEGLKIVRYSPKEETIPGYCGGDILIRFYKDENEWKGWTGEEKIVIGIGQNIQARRFSMNLKAFLEVTNPFERRMFGPDNESAGLIGGYVTYEQLKEELRKNRVFCYTGTQPASYTLSFIEAMMTGIPIVALGPKFCNADFPDQDTYEIPQIIENGVNGFWSDDIKQLQEYIKLLLEDDGLARRIGEAGRMTAIKLFGKEKAKDGWKKFLEKI